MLTVGDRVGGYRLIGHHPGGGFRAVSITNPRLRVHLELASEVDWRTPAVDMLRIASLVGSLEHPGVARVVDRGVVDHRAWLATELADGVALSEIMSRRTLGVDEVIELIRDVSSILVHLHERGLVHDALQPHAITMRTGARSFPLQLGGWIALRGSASPDPGKLGLGDVHALGVLAYRALTGRFPGLHVPELIPGVPGALGSLIVRMLAADPADRPEAAAVALEISILTGDRSLAGPRFARPRWTPSPSELVTACEVITLPRKRV